LKIIKPIFKLDIPILVIQGTTDIQVDVANATLLAKANPNAQLQVIEGMNHILKPAPLDRTANITTYSMPNLPLIEGFVNRIAQFLN